MKITLTIFVFFFGINSFSQTDSISQNGFTIPKTLDGCIQELEKTFTQKVKQKLLSLNEDTIGYVNDIFIITEWLRPDSSRLKKHFTLLGLRYEYEMEYFILLSYYKYLKYGTSDISVILQKYIYIKDSINCERINECKFKQSLDSLEETYIPKDLTDCYNQLDYLLSDSVKYQIKNSQNHFESYFSLGQYLRNSWGLWSCSRLQKYFINNGVQHPDEMSAIIMEGYRYFLNDSIFSINELILKIPRVPPPVQAKQKIVYRNKYQRKIDRFIRLKRVEDFEVGTYSLMN